MNHAADNSNPAASDRERFAQKLRGILLPITTPFTPAEEIDIQGLKANIRTWNSSAIAGYVVLGSTGERVNLDGREYQEVIETARAEIPGDLAFVVGAGQQSRRGTINEIRCAAAAGADGVLVITPHYYRAAITQPALVDHYRAVADESPVPVLIYSMPDLTGIKVDPQTAAQLSTHPNIIGIKDSSADVPGLRETIRLSTKDFTVLTGNGTVLYEALDAGARGGILAVACVATFCCTEIFRLMNGGRNDEALALQSKLTPLALAVTKRYGIGGLKAALDMLSLAGGSVRLPLESPNAAARDEIAGLLRVVHGASSTATVVT